MRTKIKNAYVITMNSRGDVYKNGCVVLDEGLVVGCHEADAAELACDEVIDFGGDILLPGLINGHTHSAMTLFRGIADDLPLDRWLFESIFPLEKNLQKEHIYWGSYLAFLEYLRGGVTTICDMYFQPDVMLEATKKCGINCVAVGGATDFGGQAKSELEILEERFLSLNSKCDNFSYRLGAHSEYLTTDELIDGIVELSYKYKTPLYAHASETLKEVGECTTRNNDLSPICYFHKMGFFDNGATLAHCTHIDKDDMALMSQSRVSAVTNPCSNLKLASGIAPIYTMQKNGVNMGIGTDGAASNNALDMFREMYLVSTLSKMQMHDASVISAEDTLRMATEGGAKALYLSDRGSIEAGKRADLVRLDVSSPKFRPHNNLLKNVIYCANASDVKMTMVGGKVLYENGVYHIGESESDIYKNCEKAIKYLVKTKGE